MAFGDEQDIFDKKGLQSRPSVKVYKRPERKNVSSSYQSNDCFIKEDLKSSAWKQDEKVVEIVNKLSHAQSYKSEDFTNLDFSGAVMRNAKMQSCSFINSLFIGTDMQGGDFNHSDFKCADLTNANFAGANLSYADLSGANLSGAIFDGADLTGAKIDCIIISDSTGFGGVIADAPVQKNIDKIMLLQEAAEKGELDLRTLGIVDLRKLDLRSINLKGVYLKDKDLKGRLSGVNLSGAIINDSDIMGADINMLHYWVNNINETNEITDNKQALKKELSEQKSEQAYQESSEAMKKELELESKVKAKKEEEVFEYKKMLEALHKKNKPKARGRIRAMRGKIIS